MNYKFANMSTDDKLLLLRIVLMGGSAVVSLTRASLMLKKYNESFRTNA